jgi:hypothetical protein
VTDPNKPPSANYTFFSMDNWSDASNHYMKQVRKFEDEDWDDIMMKAKPFIRSRGPGASEPPPVPDDDDDAPTGLEMREAIESDSDEAVEEFSRQQRAPVPVRPVVFDKFPAAGGHIRPPSRNPPTFEEIPRQQRAPVPARPVVIHEFPADHIRPGPPSRNPPTSYPTSYPTFRYPAGEGASHHRYSYPPPDRQASRRPQQVMSRWESSAHPRGMPVYQGGIANKSALPSSGQASSSRGVTVDVASSIDRTHVGSPDVIVRPMGEGHGMDTPIISFSYLTSNVDPPYQDDNYTQDVEAGMYYRDGRACAAGDREYYDMDGYEGAEPGRFGMYAFCAIIYHYVHALTAVSLSFPEAVE